MNRLFLILLLVIPNLVKADTEISTAATNLGIGTTSVKNALSIASTLAVGSTYVNTTAPSNGLIVQGNVGIGSLNPAKALDVTGTIKASLGVNIGTTSPVNIYYSPTTAFPTSTGSGYRTGTIDSLNVLPSSTNSDINLYPNGDENGQVNLMIGDGIGFLPQPDGPSFGTSIGGMQYRTPAESMAKNFFIWRGGQYVFENDSAEWQVIFTPTGVNIGSLADNTLVPVSKFEVNGNAAIGSDLVRAHAAPTNGLLVEGNVSIGTTSAPVRLSVNDSANDARIQLGANNGSVLTELISNSSTGLSYLGSSTNNPLVLRSGSNEAMRISTSQNVGIGSVNPGQMLDVQGTVRAIALSIIGGTSSQFLKANGTIDSSTYSTTSSANPTGTIGLSAVNGSASTFLRSDGAPALSVAISPTWTGNHIFAPSSGNTVFTAGNVGIGSSTPAALLDVVGTLSSNFGTNVGIGSSSPGKELDVNGTVRTKGFYLTTNPSSGYVLTSNSVGIGTWAPSSGGGGGGGDMLATLVNSSNSITSAASALISTMNVVSGTSANYNVTLPAAGSNSGKFVGIRIDGSATKLFTLVTGGENIDGASTRIMWAGESAILLSDGTNWTKVAGRSIPMSAQMTLGTSQTLTNGANVTITLDTSIGDNTGQMSDTGNNRINILRPSTYTILASITGASTSDGATTAPGMWFSYIKTDGNFTEMLANAYITPSYAQVLATGIKALSAGDNVQLAAAQITGVSENAFGNGTLSNGPCALTVIEIPQW